MFRSSHPFLRTLALGLFLAGAMPTVAAPAPEDLAASETIVSYTRAAGQVFRGRCIEVRDTTVELGGGRLPATAYVFAVIDGLKGVSGERVEFRQIGRRDGGPQDLGRRVGLPVYRLGEEYVLFLLPHSSAGLTSPAGAAEGVFALEGELLQPVATGHGLRWKGVGEAADAVRRGSVYAPAASIPGAAGLDYAGLRRIVLAEGSQ
ncbi:MAG: hypothetical protein AAF481_00255 [Acidobacteriota bacterium]